jgi:cytochrome c oxidase assembly factor CtaG
VAAAVSPLTSWTFDPIQLTGLALLGFVYYRRVRTLAERGTPVETWRQWSYGSGLALLFIVLASPVDALGEKQFLFVHMIQHIVIGDLAPLLMVAGLTGPILRPLLAYIHPLRRLFHPVVALLVWASLLAFWHIPFFYEAALHHAWAHALEHICFFVGGTLIWVPLLETLPMPEWFGTGMKMGFIVVVRVYESILGNIFVWANKPFYSTYVHAAHRPWNLTAVNDQRIAGSIMMVEGSFVTLLVLAWFFMRLASEGELRQRLLESGLDPRAVRRAVRYGRAQEMEQPR